MSECNRFNNSKLKVFRFDPEVKKGPYFEYYNIPVISENMSVLEALRYVVSHIDPTLAFRDYFCKTNQCGMCVMQINGVNSFACHTKIEKEMEIKPAKNYPVIKDLVVDFGKADKYSCICDGVLQVYRGC